MRLFTPFTIPKKENCDLCRIEKNKKKQQKIIYQITFLKPLIGKDSFSTDLQLLGSGLWLEYQPKEKPFYGGVTKICVRMFFCFTCTYVNIDIEYLEYFFK